MITDADRVLAREFCDAIGCTEVHHLRDELPAFVAKIREGFSAKGHPEAYGLPTTIQEAVEEVHAWREASEAIGYVTPDGLRTNIIALQRDLSNAQAKYASLQVLTVAALEKAEREINRDESALLAMQESTRDTCGSVAKALGYEGTDDGDALVARAQSVADALRWYADERNWKADWSEYDAPSDCDRGQRARLALKGSST